VRALVVERSELPFEVGQAEGSMLTGDRFDAALRKLLRLEDLEPYGALAAHSAAFRRPESFHDLAANVKDVL
jgi:hypothetical protein